MKRTGYLPLGERGILSRMHREEREFSIVLHLRGEFGDDYTGDDDGFAWFERWESTVKPSLLNAVVESLRRDPAFQVAAAPRGRDPDRAIDVDVIFRPSSTNGAESA